MSGFLSSKYLKYRQAAELGPIDHDLACTSCGYNVRGLKWRQNCPECGTTIEPELAHDVLLAGEWRERSAWRLGLLIGALSLSGAVLMRLGFLVGSVTGFAAGGAWAYLVTGVVLGTTWTVAAWLMTPRRLLTHWPRLGGVRVFIRVSQVLWPAAYLNWMIGLADGAAVLGDWSRVLRFVAGLGVVLLAYVLIRVAEEAERESASRRLVAVVWFLPITTLLGHAFPPSINWFTLVPLGVLLALWTWVMILFTLSLLELHRHVKWSMISAEELHTRSRRIAETRGTLDAELETSVRPPPASLPELPLSPPSDSNPDRGAP